MTNVKEYLPQTLSGPRTYFSLIDRYNVNLVENWEQYKRELDQIMKILLLTKDTIVIAASTLCTEKALDYFLDNPEKEVLFKNGIIRPAIRSQFQNFNEVFLDRIQTKKENLPKTIDEFFSNAITEVVPWNLNENSSWFASSIKEQVDNKNSILRGKIRERSTEQEVKFVSLLNQELEFSRREGQYFDRDRVNSRVRNSLEKVTADAICQFIDLMYFISGSRVVNCENYIPQENLIYFSHSTFSYNQKVVSEKDIFYNVVINIFLNDLWTNVYPIDILSNISFKDILELRKRNESKAKAFREKYDKCLAIAESMRSIDDKERLLLTLGELYDISLSLRKEFQTSITDEIEAFRRLNESAENINFIWELIMEALGIVTSLPISLINLILNNASRKNIDLVKRFRSNVLEFKENTLRNYVEKTYKNDPVLTSFLKDLIELHKQNYMQLDYGKK